MQNYNGIWGLMREFSTMEKNFFGDFSGCKELNSYGTAVGCALTALVQKQAERHGTFLVGFVWVVELAGNRFALRAELTEY